MLRTVLMIMCILATLLCSGLLKINTAEGQKTLPDIVRIWKEKK